MRIDSGSPTSEPPARLGAGSYNTEGADFGELLRSFSESRQTANTPASSDLKPWVDLGAYTEIRAQKAEAREQTSDLEETRRDGYLDGLEANQDEMDDLVKDWKDRSPYKSEAEVSTEADQEAEQLESELDEVDGSDDGADIVSDFEDMPLEHDYQGEHEGAPGHQGRSPQQQAESESTQAQVRELNYQEIQALVETALHSGRHLLPRVRQILQELLNALLDGQRWLLDQQRLIGLEQYEWETVFRMFPDHFYGGLLRQHRHSALPLYDILQNLYEQTPPQTHEDLISLWQPVFGDASMPLLLRNWILDQPLLPEDQELINLLELWQQQQSLPPGALGRILQLSLAYQHHPDKMHELFIISKQLLHGQPLSEPQLELLSRSISERCFQLELTQPQQIQNLLKTAMQGHELSEADILLLTTGCHQGVLSYLPYSLLHPSLQELLNYVRRDLLGHEEQVPALLQEEENALPL